MQFTVLNWNIGGAKFLKEKTRDERERTRTKINQALLRILIDRSMGPQPDVVTLQEIVRYKEPDDEEVKDLFDAIPGYSYFSFPLIDSNILSSKAKWNMIKKDSDWDPNTYFAQGNAFLIKNKSKLRNFPVWDLWNLDQPRPENSKDHFIELVHLDSGLYFGDRNTEPRAALVAHFIYDPGDKPGPAGNAIRKPLDIFVINVHMTTLMMEREGVPEIDTLAAKIRRAQLNVVFNGIVSRYNSWRQSGYRERGDIREEEASFKITERSIENMKLEGVPDDVLQKLKSMRNTPIRGKERFLDVLKTTIGETLSVRYNSVILKHAEKELHETFKRHSPIWIIAGDFNFTEESAEYAFIKRMNFIDTVPKYGKVTQWGDGTKSSGVGNDPTLTLDYIFAGPKFVSLDPAIEEKGLHGNRVFHDHSMRVSDHYPVLSSMTLIPS